MGGFHPNFRRKLPAKSKMTSRYRPPLHYKQRSFMFKTMSYSLPQPLHLFVFRLSKRDIVGKEKNTNYDMTKENNLFIVICH